MISGAAGALAVVVTELTIDDGVLDYLSAAQRLNVLYMTMFVCGLAQILFAWLRLANLVKLIPQTGLIGFSTYYEPMRHFLDWGTASSNLCIESSQWTALQSVSS